MSGKQQLSTPLRAKLKIDELKIVEYGKGKNKTVVPAEFYLNNARDKLLLHPDFEQMIRACLETEVNVNYVSRKENNTIRVGINAHSVNIALRKCLSTIPNIHFETSVKDGCFFPQKQLSDFDFAIYDETSNFKKIWNKAYGERGNREFVTYLNSVSDEKFNIDWETFQRNHDDEIISNQNNNCDFRIFSHDNNMNVTGEIQFGNWGLIYKDMFRLLSAEKQCAPIDLYIYIVASGNLATLISSQTVNYKRAFKEFKYHTFNRDIPTNIWIIPIDIEYKTDDLDSAKTLYDKLKLEYDKLNEQIKQCTAKIDNLKEKKSNSISDEEKNLLAEQEKSERQLKKELERQKKIIITEYYIPTEENIEME